MWPQNAALAVACSSADSLDKRKRCVQLLLLRDRPSERVMKAAFPRAVENRLIERARKPPTDARRFPAASTVAFHDPDGEIMLAHRQTSD
eukprot:scaffold245947_cov27-Tisochrysis_lutea.AAC.1